MADPVAVNEVRRTREEILARIEVLARIEGRALVDVSRWAPPG